MSRAVIDEIAAERYRQVLKEGWTPEHDSQWDGEQLSAAAACYALSPKRRNLLGKFGVLGLWPWSPEWWKPKDRRRDLIRAGALIVAEIERMDRQGGKP